MRNVFCFAAIVLLVGAVIIGCTQRSEVGVTPATHDSIDSTTVSFANTKCPIMGGKPTAELTVQHEGQTIGFCCQGCPEKWSALTADQQRDELAKVQSPASHAQPGGATDSGQ